MTADPGRGGERDHAGDASRKRLAFWIWMGGIALILTGAALAGESSLAGGITGFAGVIVCLIGRSTRIAAEQRKP